MFFNTLYILLSDFYIANILFSRREIFGEKYFLPQNKIKISTFFLSIWYYEDTLNFCPLLIQKKLFTSHSFVVQRNHAPEILFKKYLFIVQKKAQNY